MNYPLELGRAIEEVENFFYKEKEGRLYRFLLDIIEKNLIENILQRTNGNKLKAARILGINRNTMHTKVKRLKINVKKFKD